MKLPSLTGQRAAQACLSLLLTLWALLATALPAAVTNSFTIPAYAFDRGNARTYSASWADAEPMVGYGGEYPTYVEYEIPIPTEGVYTLKIRYAAAAARPVDFWLGSKLLGKCCRTATGSWKTSQAKWEDSFQLNLTAGCYLVRLERAGAFPHVVALRFETTETWAKDWQPRRPGARKLADPPPAIKLAKDKTPEVSAATLRLAIEDLCHSFGDTYSQGTQFLRQLDELEAEIKHSSQAATNQIPALQVEIQKKLAALQRQALLANPLLGFGKLMLVKRPSTAPGLGLPANWQSNSSLSPAGFDDSVCVLALDQPDMPLQTLFKPETPGFVGDVDLNFDADKMLVSMRDARKRWQVFEVRADGSGLRRLTGEQEDVDSYDACYLPDGRILFTSTASFVGVPCVYGSSHVSTLFTMDAHGKNIRQLGFDQEHDWCPTVMNNGRVMYTRWEYTDTPHSNTRLLFHMNPDGTSQMEFLGSNSYWPNSFFYARPIPGHPTKIVSVISGHHGDRRMGELVVFDPARGRFEAEGAVQKIPGYAQKVEMVFKDQLTAGLFPKFLHPYPLSEKHFLVACKPDAQALWGIYLVDTFDNMVLLKQMPGYALLEPVPLQKTPRPPVIPDKVDLSRKDTVVYIQDIYAGEGLKGIPRGTVKQLRVFTYHFAYQGMGGLLGVIGADGPWDIKRVLGTVPVCEDGSVQFRAPANTPISVQPLDAEGKAMQLMRSWMTGMPGELMQCAGCHEKQNQAPLQRKTMALSQAPDEITPWHGPTRGFNYDREVQPVIDRHCISCHNGKPQADGQTLSDLRGTEKVKDWKSVTPGNGGKHAGKFSVGYAELHRYVRRPGIESDYHVLEPMEFHADTTALVQLIKKGHYGVQLDAEGWDRLITWIDLNCPYHGTWSEELDKPGTQRERRRDLLKLYGNVEDDPEGVTNRFSTYPTTPLLPPAQIKSAANVTAAGWPFDATEAVRRQLNSGSNTLRKIDLGSGVVVDLVMIPAGEFVMGNPAGTLDEQPKRMRIEKAFWMATREIDNRTFALFDPRHDSRIEDKNTYQFGVHGYPANQPEQPVVRVSWNEAIAFCRWLSSRTGMKFDLPTEDQWEYGCRAGTTKPFYYGGFDQDFSKYANLADARLSEFASDPYTVAVPLKNPTKYDDWIPKDTRFNDGALLTVAPGRYQPNAWGLFDMHGNASEWTRSVSTSNEANSKVVRGGSWRDVPKRATSYFRISYPAFQRVHNVGFRVMCEVDPG
jgi:formylglycine-generating enzyme required for sulfatase activity